MDHRIGLAGAAERRGRKAVQVMIGELEPGMLTGDEQVR